MSDRGHQDIYDQCEGVQRSQKEITSGDIKYNADCYIALTTVI